VALESLDGTFRLNLLGGESVTGRALVIAPGVRLKDPRPRWSSAPHRPRLMLQLGRRCPGSRASAQPRLRLGRTALARASPRPTYAGS
jgi:hypothetical protein